METLHHMYDTVMADPDAEIMLFMMVILLLFAAAVICWAVLNWTHSARLKRRMRKQHERLERERARKHRKMVKNGQIESMAAKQQKQPQPQRNWGKEAARKFVNYELKPTSQSDGEKPEETTGEFQAVGSEVGSTATA